MNSEEILQETNHCIRMLPAEVKMVKKCRRDECVIGREKKNYICRKDDFHAKMWNMLKFT